MKWGILATGTIAAKFADTVNQMEEQQQLVACASRTKEKAEAFRAKYRIARAYDSYEAMVQDPEVEAVYVASPNNYHYEHCVLCLEHGKHVLCEKPFTVKREEAERLYTLAEEKGLFIMEAFWTRFMPALRKMQELIKEGVIGEVVWARSDFGFVATGARKDRKFDSALAGGALLDIGIYNLGFMRMVMGNQQPEAFESQFHINEYGTDDFHTILLKYPEGKSATVTASIGMNMQRYASVHGTKGSILLDDYQIADHILVNPEDGEPYTLEFPIEINGFEYEIREVQRCTELGMNTSDILSREDTLEILELMEQIRKSWGMTFACE